MWGEEGWVLQTFWGRDGEEKKEAAAEEEEEEEEEEGEEDVEKSIYMLMPSSALQLPRWVQCPLPSNELLAGKPVAMFTQ